MSTPATSIQSYLALASLLGQMHGLGGVSQALREVLRLPLEGVETKAQHSSQSARISEATRHGNTLVGHRYRLLPSACIGERTGQAGQHPAPQRTLYF